MGVWDGIVKNTVNQDTMVIYVQRHVSVKLTCVIYKQVASHHRMTHVSFTPIKCKLM